MPRLLPTSAVSALGCGPIHARRADARAATLRSATAPMLAAAAGDLLGERLGERLGLSSGPAEADAPVPVQ